MRVDQLRAWLFLHAWRLSRVAGGDLAEPARRQLLAGDIAAAGGVALLGAFARRAALLRRSLYGREELYQLLFTYALVLILGDVAKFLWGTNQTHGLPSHRAWTVASKFFGVTTQPIYNLFVLGVGPAIAFFRATG